MRHISLRTLVIAVGLTALLITPATVWAIDRFVDVPDSNVFHDDITWLAQAGVTLGCNPPDNDAFCPNEPVTREQMAAFMRRLAENRVVDAASVGGRTALELRPAISESRISSGFPATSSIPLAANEQMAITTLDLSIDHGKYALVDFGYHAKNNDRMAGTTGPWLQIDDTDCTLASLDDPDVVVPGSHAGQGFGPGQYLTVMSSVAVELTKDTLLTLCATVTGGGVDILNAHLNAIQSDVGSVDLNLAS